MARWFRWSLSVDGPAERTGVAAVSAQKEVRNGTATCGKNGIITTPSDVGGWPSLRTGTAPVDSDRDGMPDAWETAYGLDPSNKEDGKKTHLSPRGYTNLEMYLDELGGDPLKWAE